MVIYKITNTQNNRVYIGQTVGTIAKRWNEHSTSRKNSPLYNAFRKYGRECFKIEVICSALAPEHLNELEQYFIKAYNSLTPNGYNLTSGGDSGYSRSEESKAKMSKSMMGHAVSEETRAKISAKLRGRPGNRLGQTHTEETKKFLSEMQKGRIITDEHKQKIREGMLKTERHNARKVECIETGVVYKTATEAAKMLNLQQSSISTVCRGERKSTGGLRFRYVD